jgi:hypothetical protein
MGLEQMKTLHLAGDAGSCIIGTNMSVRDKKISELRHTYGPKQKDL